MRTLSRALLVPLTLLALTASAGGKTGPYYRSFILTTSPVLAANGFEMSMDVFRPGPHRSAAWLTISFTKKSGPVMQRHTWDIGLGRRDLRCNTRQTRCALDTHGDLRNPIGQPVGQVRDYGRVRLRFVASSPIKPVPLPGRCMGTKTRAAMSVRGSFRFNTHYALLGGVRTVGREAIAVRSAENCTPLPCTGATDLQAWRHLTNNDFANLWLHGTGAQDHAYLLLQWGTPGPYASHEIVVENVPWTAAPDLSSATFDARGLPLFSGRLDYHADSRLTIDGGCNGPGSGTADNNLSGDLVVRPDGHDPIVFDAAGSGRLVRWP